MLNELVLISLGRHFSKRPLDSLACTRADLRTARREAGEHARARETVEERLKREGDERVIWERLAQDTETEKAELVAKLATLQVAAAQAPNSEIINLVERGEEAATKIDLDEAGTRALIDQQLRDRGWEADTKSLRHADGVRPAKGRSMAIAEWPTASGPADYALFAGTVLVRGRGEATKKERVRDDRGSLWSLKFSWKK